MSQAMIIFTQANASFPRRFLCRRGAQYCKTPSTTEPRAGPKAIVDTPQGTPPPDK
jgi:hypothetical protein